MPGGDVADNNLQRNHAHPLDQGLSFIELSNEMGGNAVFLQITHQAVAHLVVYGALAGNAPFFQTVEGSGVVFIGDDQRLRVVGPVDPLRLSLIQQLSFFHSDTSLLMFDSSHAAAAIVG